MLNAPASPGEPGACGEGGPRSGAGQLIVLVTSPRVAPGQLTLDAWDALRGAARVLCGHPDHPQLPALAAAGIACEVLDGPAPGPAGPGLAVALAAAAAQADGPVVWLAGGPARLGLGPGIGTGPGGPGEDAGTDTGALLSALRERGDEGPGTVLLRGSADVPGARLLDLVATMEILRTECPWDAKQTHESLAPHLLEEPYEALEALENGDHRALREELGDVLMQVIFHAEIASERDDGTGYSVDDVADGIVTKLVRRHPHVFAGVTVSGADEVKQNWDAIKRAERAGKAAPGDAPSSALDGVPFGQAALALAAQLQRRAARAGIPPDLARATGPDGDPGASLGDRLFGLVAAAGAEGLDPEAELRAAARRYAERVRAWERAQPGR